MRFIAVVALFITACTSQKNTNANVSITFPTAAQLGASQLKQQKINAGDIDWNKACFMVNVTGDGIDSTATNKCELPAGIFAGSVKPGGTLTLDVAKGKARKFEIFAYFRPSNLQDCTIRKSINHFDPGSTASLGKTIADLSNDKETVAIDVTLPTASDSLLTQFNLPAFCASGAVVNGDGSSRILTARATGATSHFKVESVVTGLPTGPASKTASGLIVRFSHAANKDAP